MTYWQISPKPPPSRIPAYATENEWTRKIFEVDERKWIFKC